MRLGKLQDDVSERRGDGVADEVAGSVGDDKGGFLGGRRCGADMSADGAEGLGPDVAGDDDGEVHAGLSQKGRLGSGGQVFHAERGESGPAGRPAEPNSDSSSTRGKTSSMPPRVALKIRTPRAAAIVRRALYWRQRFT